MRSRPESWNSSGEDAYSTSATTCEDGDEKRQSGENRRGRDSGMKQEAKGNVIVSVRIRPDAGGDKTAAKDFLVDGRQSLVAYKGKEAGDYYYGECHLHQTLHEPTKFMVRIPAALAFADSVFR